MRRIFLRFTLSFLLLGLPVAASAEPLKLDPAALATSMPGLARAALAQYQDSNPERLLTTRLRLQLVAGEPAAALETIQTLRELQAKQGLADADIGYLQYELYARAHLASAAENTGFEPAFKAAFRSRFAGLSGPQAFRASQSFSYDLPRAEQAVQRALGGIKPGEEITLDTALRLLRDYQPWSVYQAILPLSPALLAEDEANRYSVEAVRVRSGAASLSAYVVRPKGASKPLPAALLFTIYAEPQRSWAPAVQAAARGYAGVVAFSRGKLDSPDQIAPYEHEATDVNAVIDWISKEPWNDGRVAMYGGSYEGFSQWAALKNPHPALKTIVPYVAAIPGLGLPMENNVFLTANYGWAFYVGNNRTLDHQGYNDPQRWNQLSDRWFESGRPFREIDRVDGTPNPLLQRWLKHPSYDAYWQAMVPYGPEFARIKIPVLSITGYYDDGQISAIEYVKQHYQHNPKAEHYLVIGPYDHFGAQSYRKQVVLRGYAIDPVAQIDTPRLTFDWLDHVLRGGPLPALLKDKINYQLMGANRWGHAASPKALEQHPRKLYLDGDKLSNGQPARAASRSQTVDLKDRQTSHNDYYPSPILRRELEAGNGLLFISEPLAEAVTLAGSFSGRLKLTINKRDVDLGLVLYELTPAGEYIHLSYFLGRASHVADMSRRQLLTPGKPTALAFSRTRMVARELQKGSRLVLIANVNKNSGAQLNHGTGKDVSRESAADAGAPLTIRWHNDSYISLPIQPPASR